MFDKRQYFMAAGCIALGALLRLTMGLGNSGPTAITIPTSLSCPFSSVLGLNLTGCDTQPTGARATIKINAQGTGIQANTAGAVHVNTNTSPAVQANTSDSVIAGVKVEGTDSNCGCGTTAIGLPSVQLNAGATLNNAIKGGVTTCGCGSDAPGGLNLGAGLNARVNTNANVGVMIHAPLGLDP